MKKFLTVALTLIFALSMCACGDSGSDSSEGKYAGSDYVGTWVLVGYEVDGQSFPMGEHESTQLTLKADGTFVDISEAYQEETEDAEAGWHEVTTIGTWEETEDGFKTSDEIFTLEYKVKDGKAKADYESTTLVREKK